MKETHLKIFIKISLSCEKTAICFLIQVSKLSFFVSTVLDWNRTLLRPFFSLWELLLLPMLFVWSGYQGHSYIKISNFSCFKILCLLSYWFRWLFYHLRAGSQGQLQIEFLENVSNITDLLIEESKSCILLSLF